MAHNHYVKGQWNVICDSCGWKKKSSEVRRRWDGLIVCADTCYETDHPQKYLRVRETGLAVPFIRDEPADTYQLICYIYAIRAYADLGEADCMRADLATPSYASLYAMKTASLG
jgi:hypothetical protein